MIWLWTSALALASAPAMPDFAGLPATADVQTKAPDGKLHPVRARLFADHDAVAPGQTFRVGLHLTQDEGWHTYWKSPGDIGLPTTATWTLPEGWTSAPFGFPVPERHEQDGMVSYGYDAQVAFSTPVTVAAGAAPGPVTVRAHVEWLVCKSSCIPGSADLELPLTVGAATPSKYGATLDAWAATLPVGLSQSGLSVSSALSHSAIEAGKPFRAAFAISGGGPSGGKKWPTFTPIVGSDFMVTAIDVQDLADGRVLVVVGAEAFEPDPLPTQASIGGLIQLDVAGKRVATEVSIPLPFVAKGTSTTPSSDPVWSLAQMSPPAAPPPPGGEGSAPPVAAASTPAASGWLLGNLALAFLGGLLLNIMPCVLPVLTLKLYDLVEQAGASSATHRRAGLAYTAGILASFLLLAAVTVATREAFGAVGWGFQFQYPGYVAALATLVFVFGLSLFGVFEIPAFGSDHADSLAGRDGPVGYFFHGVFATLVATPCSAPFLGTAVAFAMQAPALELTLVLLTVGLGLAAPFLLVAFVPALYGFLPQPGAWMETFKQFMGFTLMATTLWLVDVLGAQVGFDRTVGFLAFLGFVAMGAWIFGRFGGLAATRQEQAQAFAGALVVAGLGGGYFLDLAYAEAGDCKPTSVDTAGLAFDEHIPWQPFSDAALASVSDRVVFVDFTAEWCVTCKANERLVLETDEVRGAMSRHQVVPLKADWTRRDPEISAWLERYQKAGVPFYLAIPKGGGAPIPLPEVITPAMVVGALDQAAGH